MKLNDAVITKPTARISQYDILRALAIVFVVIGHAIQGRTDFDNNYIFKAIYIFHMPVFFYICGMVYALKPLTATSSQFGRGILRRAEQLLLPYFAWHALNYFIYDPDRTVLEHFVLLYKSADNGLWFFWVLFSINVLTDIGKIVHGRFKVSFWAISIALIFLTDALMDYLVRHDMNRLGIGLIDWYLPFFLAGIYHKQLVEAFGKYEKLLGTICAIGFIFMVHYWFRNFSINTSQILGNQIPFLQHHYVQLAFLRLDTLIKYIYAAVGIVVFFMLAKQLYASNEILEKVMVFLGQRTLEIYAIHFYFIGVRYFPSNMMWDCFLASAGAIMLALLISEYLIKPVPIASWLLLGRRSK